MRLQLLAVAGKFPGEGGYKDGRFGSPADAGDLTANLGRMPLLRCKEGSIGQSSAINFYLATELGLMGKSTYEQAQILAMQEHLKELKAANRELLPRGAVPSEDYNEKWFEGGAERPRSSSQ